MTEQNGSQSPAEERTGAPEGEAIAETPKVNREARYRTERNAARAERDALAERVETLQTRELERIASKSLSNPADLLTLSGKAMADFLDESGELDAELITGTARELLGSRPGLGLTSPAFDPTQGHSGNPGKGSPTWSNLLK